MSASDKLKITCAGCGKPGISICSFCSKKPGYRKLAARANPLHKRDPQLYKRLDELSHTPLDENNKPLWDEFWIEIQAGALYEDLPTLVEIVREGKWRTEALNPKVWLRQQLVNRVRKNRKDDDYAANGRRRRGRPKFDRRNGALVKWETRPYAEFEICDTEGKTLSADEAIDGRIARAELQRGGGYSQQLADRESLRSLRGQTYAESIERSRAESLIIALEHDRPEFDKVLAQTIREQQPLATKLGLDPDEAEVLAVIVLLWSEGARVYLKFVDQAKRKRLRNAWDRLDRKEKKPEFRPTLREFAEKSRRELEREDHEDHDDSREELKYRQENHHRIPPDQHVGHGCERCGALDRRFCICELGGGRKRKLKPEAQVQLRASLERQSGTLLPPSPSDTAESVDEGSVVLGWDIDSKRQALYHSSSKKPPPRHRHRLYSE